LIFAYGSFNPLVDDHHMIIERTNAIMSEYFRELPRDKWKGGL